MERESSRLSALHLVGQLKSELHRLKGEASDAGSVASSVLHSSSCDHEQQHPRFVDPHDHDDEVSSCASPDA
ncbi:unnamed protein product [Gongylonema pulchrum]|uniref:Uncharacterized protein n=1 Tax=Gongylonema pulchrum TaxID=637853 RepID=A0A183EVC1_9BILA|nr:unnamed protein product [Gongylonema pulchrum]